MVWHPTKEACKRLWGRRWTRRITYLLAAGVGVSFGGSWLLQRPAVSQWAVSKADAWLREETGLGLTVDRVEVHPLFGSLSLDGIAIGGDLLTIRHVDLRVDPSSFVLGTPHIFTARIVEPHARLSPDRAARIHLKPSPDTSKKTPEVLLDLLSVKGGKVEVLEPVWGLPEGELDFDLKGRGLGPNQVRISLVAPLLRARGPKGDERGRADLDGDLSDHWMVLRSFKGQLGPSRLSASGAFQPRDGHRFELKADASTDLAQLLAWLGQRAPAFTGRLETKAEASGTLAEPRWTFFAKGSDLKPGDTRFAPGALEAQAKGTAKEAILEQLRWESPQGRFDANGRWSQARTVAHVDARGVSLDPLSQAPRPTPAPTSRVPETRRRWPRPNCGKPRPRCPSRRMASPQAGSTRRSRTGSPPSPPSRSTFTRSKRTDQAAAAWTRTASPRSRPRATHRSMRAPWPACCRGGKS